MSPLSLLVCWRHGKDFFRLFRFDAVTEGKMQDIPFVPIEIGDTHDISGNTLDYLSCDRQASPSPPARPASFIDDIAGMGGTRLLELHLALDRNCQFAMFRIVRQDPNLALDLAGLHSFKDRLYIQAELPIFAALWGARDAKKRHI